MQDKYINATKLIERLKCEKRREVAEAASNPFSTGPAPEIRISQIYDGVVSVLEKEPAANVVPRPAPKWPICQNCGRPNQTVPKDDFKAIREAAVNLAVEAIQVAAMAKKFEHGQRNNWPGAREDSHGEEKNRAGSGNGDNHHEQTGGGSGKDRL